MKTNSTRWVLGVGLVISLMFTCVVSQREQGSSEFNQRRRRRSIDAQDFVIPVHVASKGVEMIPMSREHTQTQSAKAIASAHAALRKLANNGHTFSREAKNIIRIGH